MQNGGLRIVGMILLILTTAGIMLSYYFMLPYLVIGAIAVAGYGIGAVLFIMGKKKVQ